MSDPCAAAEQHRAPHHHDLTGPKQPGHFIGTFEHAAKAPQAGRGRFDVGDAHEAQGPTSLVAELQHARDVGQRRQALVGDDDGGAVGRQMRAARDRDGPPQPGHAGGETVDLAVESPRVDDVGPGEATLHHLHQGRDAGDRAGQGGARGDHHAASATGRRWVTLAHW
jgi:hypothetical protein